MTDKQRKSIIVTGGEPRANLLPPVLVIMAKQKGTRKVLASVLLLTVIAVVGGFTFARLEASRAEDSLVLEQERGVALITERATFTAAVSMLAETDSIVSARALTTSTEVLWNDQLTAIEAHLPAGASVEQGTFLGRAPWEPETALEGPLLQPRIATLTLVVKSATVLDATALVRGLAGLPGFADATPTSLESVDGGFRTTIILHVNEGALAGRFPAEATEVAE